LTGAATALSASPASGTASLGTPGCARPQTRPRRTPHPPVPSARPPLLPLLQASLADLSVVDYVAADPEIQKTGKNKDDVVAALRSVSFDDEMMAKPITGISGGWKMKLALTRCGGGAGGRGGGRPAAAARACAACLAGVQAPRRLQKQAPRAPAPDAAR
jgi:hypothetical protein